MTPEQKLTLSLTVLLAGLVIVFVVLAFLTYLIRGYGAAIQKLQSGTSDNTEKAAIPAPVHAAAKPSVTVEQGIPEEIIAAISAAVYMTYGSSVGNITGIRRAPVQPSRSAWSMAGLLENTRPF